MDAWFILGTAAARLVLPLCEYPSADIAGTSSSQYTSARQVCAADMGRHSSLSRQYTVCQACQLDMAFGAMAGDASVGVAGARAIRAFILVSTPDPFSLRTNDRCAAQVSGSDGYKLIISLPASYQPAELYNYHPIFPSTDIENPSSPTSIDASGKDGKGAAPGFNIQSLDDSTCSICMEHVETSAAASGLAGEALAGLGLGNLAQRRSYALAPCGHLFHTACLAQWMGVKVSLITCALVKW